MYSLMNSRTSFKISSDLERELDTFHTRCYQGELRNIFQRMRRNVDIIIVYSSNFGVLHEPLDKLSFLHDI